MPKETKEIMVDFADLVLEMSSGRPDPPLTYERNANDIPPEDSEAAGNDVGVRDPQGEIMKTALDAVHHVLYGGLTE